jgi:DNA-binding NarL/FixJ family response regulator
MKSIAAKRLPRLARILIVDEHPLIRTGLNHLFSQTKGFESAAEAATAAQAVSSVERRMPSLVLTEIDLPGRSGLDLAKELQTRFANLPVVLHSSLPERLYADRAIAVGIRGFIAKAEPTKTLLSALRAVLDGKCWYQSPDNTKNSPGTRSTPPSTTLSTLTDREFEVFRLVGRGFNTSEIASQLHISIKTVDAHREHVKRKLNLRSGTALNLLAIRWVTSQ